MNETISVTPEDGEVKISINVDVTIKVERAEDEYVDEELTGGEEKMFESIYDDPPNIPDFVDWFKDLFSDEVEKVDGFFSIVGWINHGETCFNFSDKQWVQLRLKWESFVKNYCNHAKQKKFIPFNKAGGENEN